MRQRAIRSMIGLIFLVSIMEHSFAAATNQPQADKIIILKSAHTMTLLSGDKVLKTYKVALGTVPVGPKRVEGDHKTPEGNYTIDSISPIRMQPTGKAQPDWERGPAEQS
jgi:murein L,D-transpeptidase YafK